MIVLLIAFELSIVAQEPASFRISVNVDLVVLHATVRDRKGQIVSGLRAQDFEIYEEGVRQSIRLFRHEDIPVTVGLVVDHSGSMGKKIGDVIKAARIFVRYSNPEDQMFVLNFNEKVTVGLPSTIPFTNRSEELERAISSSPATGMTALYDAVSGALERLKAGDLDKKVLVVISDGSDNASKHNLADVLKQAGQSSALVYPIGVFSDGDEDQNRRVLNRLAHATGGEAFFPSADETVAEVCERIARDIRNQYTIGYMSTSAVQNGAFRAVKVTAGTVGLGKLVIRTRAGYFAGGEKDPGAK